MGLLDVLNGMQNGPRGPSTPDAQSGGGMSPMTMMAPKVPMKPHMMKPMGKSMMAPAKSY